MSDTNNIYSEQSKYSRRYTPRHPLANDAVDRIETRELSARDIVQAMGYSSKYILSACDRLRHVLSSEILGLNDKQADSDYTPDAFLQALSLVLDIDFQRYADDIAQIQYDLLHYPYPLPQYSLRADVQFEWSAGANWMSRGAAMTKARVYLPDDIAKMKPTKRETIIQQYIEAHYHHHTGRLPYQGVIQGYHLIIQKRDEVIDRREYKLPNKR